MPCTILKEDRASQGMTVYAAPDTAYAEVTLSKTNAGDNEYIDIRQDRCDGFEA